MHAASIRLLVLPGAAVGLISCKEDVAPGGCSGHVATETQQGNTITITGTLAGGQPLMRLTQNGANQTLVSGNYNGTTASFDITGLAKGTYPVTWILSCDNADGEVEMPSSITTVVVA